MATARLRRALAALGMALAAPATAAATLDLGTLFHTPEERARLDRLRRGEPDAPRVEARAGAPSLTGFVKRSDGRHTVWIDGAPVPLAAAGAEPLFEPGSVRAYSPRSDEALKIERKTRR